MNGQTGGCPPSSPSPSNRLSQAKPQPLRLREAPVLSLGMNELTSSLRPVKLITQGGFAQHLEV